MIIIDTDNWRIGSTYSAREIIRYCKSAKLYIEYRERTYAQILTDWGKKFVIMDRQSMKFTEQEFNKIVRMDVFDEVESLSDRKPRRSIKRVSDKAITNNRVYSIERKKHLQENPQCAVYPELASTEIHHMKGRRGFADEWARNAGVPLLLDKRFWLAVSNKAHKRITEDSKWALAKGYSVLRSV